MKAIDPKLLIALGLAVIVFVAIQFMNPNKKYSRQPFWENATVESVAEVPEEALQPGNKNGSVLMWAAMSTTDPTIISALVDRGADVNESDPTFSGTPLTGAAGYSKNPDIIKKLVSLGADINKRVNNQETALMIAARFNSHPGIVEILLELGANPSDTNTQGQTAMELAKQHSNQPALAALNASQPDPSVKTRVHLSNHRNQNPLLQ